MTDSGSSVSTSASRSIIESASRAVTPSPRLYTSALSSDCSDRLNLSLFATYWRTATASATVTLPSLFTSPSTVLSAAVSSAHVTAVTEGRAAAIIAADERTAISFLAFDFFILIKLLNLVFTAFVSPHSFPYGYDYMTLSLKKS